MSTSRAAPRLERLLGHLHSSEEQSLIFSSPTSASASKKSVTVTDNRTGKTIEIPIEYNTIAAEKFKQLVHEGDPNEKNGKVSNLSSLLLILLHFFLSISLSLSILLAFSPSSPLSSLSLTLHQLHPKQMMVFDPAFGNTACCKSSISYIDGEAGILRYRGYPIEVLAEKSNFLEVAFLLINGQLPTTSQLTSWNSSILTHTYLHENLTR
jgi:hypothetical protein